MDVEQPAEFVGWWEGVFYIKGGNFHDVEGILECIHPDGHFELFRYGQSVGRGRHEHFIAKPTGFTNVHEMLNPFGVGGRELVIYRFVEDCLEVCKAPAHVGRSTDFGSPPGSNFIHAAIRRIKAPDSRMPL